MITGTAMDIACIFQCQIQKILPSCYIFHNHGFTNCNVLIVTRHQTRQGIIVLSGGSRISRWGGRRAVGGANLRCRRFLVKTYAKTKELDPVGVGRAPAAPPRIRQWF